MMQRFIFWLLIVNAPVFAAGAVPASLNLAIKTEHGALIGFQIESSSSSNGRRTQMRHTEMAYQIPGHGKVAYAETLLQIWGQDGKLESLDYSRDPHDGGAIIRFSLVSQGGQWVATRSIDGKVTTIPLHGNFPQKFADGLHDPKAIIDKQQDLHAVSTSHAGAWFDSERLIIEPVEQLQISAQPRSAIFLWQSANGWPAAALEASFDANGALAIAKIPRLGSDIYLSPTQDKLSPDLLSNDTSLPHEGQRALHRMSKSLLAGHLRYFFQYPAEALWPLPTTSGQKVRAATDAEVNFDSKLIIDVCVPCNWPQPASNDAPAQYLLHNAWLNSDYPPIARIGKRMKRLKISDTRKMQKLARQARARLSAIDYNGFANAQTAWRARRGDCTEDALLLAALARASGIPARVVNGLVYARGRYHGETNAYLPHSWVIAFVDGEWRNFDMTEGFDSSHLALTISDGEPEAYRGALIMASLLEWKAMATIK